MPTIETTNQTPGNRKKQPINNPQFTAARHRRTIKNSERDSMPLKVRNLFRQTEKDLKSERGLSAQLVLSGCLFMTCRLKICVWFTFVDICFVSGHLPSPTNKSTPIVPITVRSNKHHQPLRPMSCNRLALAAICGMKNTKLMNRESICPISGPLASVPEMLTPQFTIIPNSQNHQNSDRDARPLKVANFEKQVVIAWVNDRGGAA